MKKTVLASSAAALALLAGCSRSGADSQDLSQINGLGIASAIDGDLMAGLPESTIDCDWGNTSVNQIVVTNLTDSEQTFNVTINPTLGGDAQFFTSASAAASIDGCSLNGATNNQQTSVAPGATFSGAVVAGGGEYNLITAGQNSNMAIGSGQSQWYDFWLHLDEATDGFSNWELNYSGTGGTDASQNTQPGLFNVVQCSNDNGTITLTADPPALASPYSNNAPNAWTFNNGDPICFAFMG